MAEKEKKLVEKEGRKKPLFVPPEIESVKITVQNALDSANCGNGGQLDPNVCSTIQY